MLQDKIIKDNKWHRYYIIYKDEKTKVVIE